MNNTFNTSRDKAFRDLQASLERMEQNSGKTGLIDA
jgi:hypothetical protein